MNNIISAMVLVAAWTSSNIEHIKKIGLEVGVTGYIKVDEFMRTSDKDIYAVGDCVEVKHLLKELHVHRPLALTSKRTGRVAGHSVVMDLLGKMPVQSFKGILGTFCTKLFGWEIAVTGLSEIEVIENNFNYLSIMSESNSCSGYYPGKETIFIRMFVNKENGKVLGVQMIGKNGVVLRINTFVTAITAGLTVEQIYNLDTAYAPPFSPVYDPVIQICGKAMLKLSKELM